MPTVNNCLDRSVLPRKWQLRRVSYHPGWSRDRLIHKPIQLLEQLMCPVAQPRPIISRHRHRRQLRRLAYRSSSHLCDRTGQTRLGAGGSGRCQQRVNDCLTRCMGITSVLVQVLDHGAEEGGSRGCCLLVGPCLHLSFFHFSLIKLVKEVLYNLFH